MSALGYYTSIMHCT